MDMDREITVDIHETEYARPSRTDYLTDMDEYQCKECGFIYDAGGVEPPEDAGYYWVPHCPYCNAAMTANPVTEQSVAIALDTYRRGIGSDEEDLIAWLDRTQARARHLHGREVHAHADAGGMANE